MVNKKQQVSRFQIYPGKDKDRFPVEKHEDESGAGQQRVKLPITDTVATRAELPLF